MYRGPDLRQWEGGVGGEHHPEMVSSFHVPASILLGVSSNLFENNGSTFSPIERTSGNLSKDGAKEINVWTHFKFSAVKHSENQTQDKNKGYLS